MEKIHGVNLGNWLVLEKWMNTALFDGTDAQDEYYLPHRLPAGEYEARIRTHRSEYITERDFLTIKSWGLNAVRIPVPYFIFGDREPFIGCIDELDKAFNWAETYGIQVLIDLHTAPLSQNGFDNGGISGVCRWTQTPEEVQFVLSVLKRLSERYGRRSGLWGIEILNEPILKDMWERMNIQTRYPPVDKKLAEGSGGTTLEFMKQFYLDAFDVLRPNLADAKHVVFHDCFNLFAWKDFMQDKSKYDCVVLDTHQYLMSAEMEGCPQTLDGYTAFIREKFEKGVEEMQQHFPVICGEWCLFNSLACGMDTKGGQSVLNGIASVQKNTVTDEEKKNIYTALADAQLAAWDKGSGYFYWNYKLLTDTVNTKGWTGWDSWDLGRCIAQGWFPAEKK
jgi:glucan 1,3-beta-glucosidase